jgi:hypothetical protein
MTFMGLCSFFCPDDMYESVFHSKCPDDQHGSMCPSVGPDDLHGSVSPSVGSYDLMVLCSIFLSY